MKQCHKPDLALFSLRLVNPNEIGWQDLTGSVSGPSPSHYSCPQTKLFPPLVSFPSTASSVLHLGPPPQLGTTQSFAHPLLGAPLKDQSKDRMGLPGFQRHPFARDMLIDPGGVVIPGDNCVTHTAFAYRHSLGLRDVLISWLIHIPHATTVYASDATLPWSPARFRSQPAR